MITLSTIIAVSMSTSLLNANISELFSEARLSQDTIKPDKYDPINFQNKFWGVGE
jgi:hypothetical protein